MYLQDLLGKAYKEGMTVEEISTALETIGVAAPSGDDDIDKLKRALTKANSDAANFKKQLRERQTAEENAQQEQAEMLEKLTQQNAELTRKIALSEKTTKLLAMGYDEALALDTATAMVDGDMDKVMANQATYLDAQKKAFNADQMRKTPRPSGGSATGGVDYAKLIEEANASGDVTRAAYYTRLQAMESVSND